jgi:hypothetical protein
VNDPEAPNMTLRHIALVSETTKVPAAALDVAAAALQTQVLRDVEPVWGVRATVDAFADLDHVPPTYYPMIVRDDIGVDAAGIHLDEDFTPYGLVMYSNRWTLTASHEILELLCDPFGNELRPAESLKQGQGIVEYLVEVCDPSEAVNFSYRINGVVVSDFYFPSFFDPVADPRASYSFTGAVRKPLEVREGGYLSWRNPVDSHWWQQTWFGTPQPSFHDLGVFDASQGTSFRDWLDLGIRRQRAESVNGEAEGTGEYDALVAAYALAVRDADASSARAKRLRDTIGRLG